MKYELRETNVIPGKKGGFGCEARTAEICDTIYRFVAMKHTSKYCEVLDTDRYHSNGNNLRRCFQRGIEEIEAERLVDVTIRGDRVFLVWKGELSA